MASETVFEYARQLYAALSESAETKVIDGKETLIFTGKTTEVFGQLGISQGYYTAIWKILNDQRCVMQIQRGSRGVPSVILLDHAPDQEEFLQKASASKPLTTRQDAATLVADVQAIKRLLGGVDIRKVLVNIEERLAKLEREGKG